MNTMEMDQIISLLRSIQANLDQINNNIQDYIVNLDPNNSESLR